MPTAGTWTPLTNSPGATLFNTVLLSDGTVLGWSAGQNCHRLTPDSTGSYINGTWSSAAPMNVLRSFHPTVVLRDGRVFVVGGENGSSYINSAEIYDPVADSWTNVASFPLTHFGDDPAILLPDGTVLCGYLFGPDTYIYDPVGNSWAATGTKLNSDPSDEETWVLLPDGSVLTYEIFTQGASTANAQRYVPGSASWVATGAVPVLLSTVADEIGPALLVPDGRVFFLGTKHTAFYDPGSNTWSAGADIPAGKGCDDAPAAALVNGNILYAADTPNATAPTLVYEYDPVADVHLDVTGTLSSTSLHLVAAQTTTMLALPSGQALFVGLGAGPYVYTPVGSPSSSWAPTITRIDNNGTDYTLHGTQLNGLSAGAAFGDDAEMDSNYPIITLTSGGGTVYFCRTHNWTVGVATGSTPVKTDFSLPAGLPAGTYSLSAIANGIASSPINFTAASSGLNFHGGAATPTACGHSPAWAQ